MLTTEGLTLKWTTPAALQTPADDNHAALMAKQGIAAGGGGKAAELRALNARITQVVPELRALLKKKFKGEYQAYYAEFGFVRSGKNWGLPDDRDTRADNIENRLLPALTTHGMQADADSGTAIWGGYLRRPQPGARPVD